MGRTGGSLGTLKRYSALLFTIILIGGLLWCSEAMAADITGRWEATNSTGNFAGVIGALLTQTGTTVTGTIVNGPIDSGNITNGLFTGTLPGKPGRSIDLHLTLSQDGKTLDGVLIQHKNGVDTTIPMTFHWISSDPQNPDTTAPTVNAISPSLNQSNVQRQNLIIAVTWSKPVNGWEVLLTGKFGGVTGTMYGNDLLDISGISYDPLTHIFSMPFSSSIILDPQTTYSLYLGDSCGVDGNCWHDPYGVPASKSGNYQITFTTGNDLDVPPLVKIAGPSYYASIADAYSHLSEGIQAGMQAQAVELIENVDFNRNVPLTLQGGCDVGFRICDGFTTLNGIMTITQGSLVVDRFIVM